MGECDYLAVIRDWDSVRLGRDLRIGITLSGRRGARKAGTLLASTGLPARYAAYYPTPSSPDPVRAPGVVPAFRRSALLGNAYDDSGSAEHKYKSVIF